MKIDLGQVVYSKAGRDTGKKFIVMDVLDESYALISDGNLRKVEKPKKKKIKHLELTGEDITPLREKLKSKQKIANHEIRKALAALDSTIEDHSQESNKRL